MNLTRYTSVTSGEAWSVLAPASLSELAAVISKPRAQMKAGLPLIGGYTLRAGGKRAMKTSSASPQSLATTTAAPFL